MVNIRLNRIALLVLLVGAASITLINAALTCPEGQSLFGKRCYKVYRPSPKCSRDFNFTAANQFCQANNGQLASIHSQAQEDFITNLIKLEQKEAAKHAKCGCHPQHKDYMYWIGLQLAHSANGSVNGASWTDNTAVNYGNPTSSSFRPPFVAGSPQGSAGDGNNPSEVCPLGNEKECVQIIGFGSAVGKWTDKQCNDSHVHEVSCKCEEPGNSTAVSHHKKSSSSSSSDEDDQEVDQCQLEAAVNGFVCQYCPAGWTAFQGHCYITLAGTRSPAQFAADCVALESNLVSIHSTAENQFVMDLALSHSSAISCLIGLQLTYNSNAFAAPVIAAAWSDSTPVNYGNPTVPGFVRGTYPWAPQGVFVPQPDNQPPPGNCVIMWIPNPGAPNEPGSTWDDAACAQVSAGSSVCKS